MASAQPSRILSLDAILDAATELIDADGFESLSMRKLAGRCGVAPMTLYRYVSTKDDLLTLLAEQLFAEIPMPGEDLPWQEQVKATYRGVYRLFRDHPGLADVVARHHLNASSAFRGAGVVFSALERAGLSAEDAISAFVLLTSYVAGYAQRQAHTDRDRALRDRRLSMIKSLPPAEFGLLPALALAYVAELTDERFEAGLEMVLQGIAIRGQMNRGESGA